MADDELPIPHEEAEVPQPDPATYAIRRVREVVAATQLIQREQPTDAPEPAPKAKIDWQLHAWSGPRKGARRPLGMAEMGGPQQARPNDGARAGK